MFSPCSRWFAVLEACAARRRSARSRSAGVVRAQVACPPSLITTDGAGTNVGGGRSASCMGIPADTAGWPHASGVCASRERSPCSYALPSYCTDGAQAGAASTRTSRLTPRRHSSVLGRGFGNPIVCGVGGVGSDGQGWLAIRLPSPQPRPPAWSSWPRQTSPAAGRRRSCRPAPHVYGLPPLAGNRECVVGRVVGPLCGSGRDNETRSRDHGGERRASAVREEK